MHDRSFFMATFGLPSFLVKPVFGLWLCCFALFSAGCDDLWSSKSSSSSVPQAAVFLEQVSQRLKKLDRAHSDSMHRDIREHLARYAKSDADEKYREQLRWLAEIILQQRHHYEREIAELEYLLEVAPLVRPALAKLRKQDLERYRRLSETLRKVEFADFDQESRYYIERDRARITFWRNQLKLWIKSAESKTFDWSVPVDDRGRYRYPPLPEKPKPEPFPSNKPAQK